VESGAGGGSGGGGSAGGEDGSGNSGGKDDTGPPGGSGGDAGGGGSEGTAGNCTLTSSNPVCADCLADKCCMVINKCMDADLFGCIACIDCFLEGKGEACCDETVGKNGWIEECVAWNCDSEC
jgi:hypothetical protein